MSKASDLPGTPGHLRRENLSKTGVAKIAAVTLEDALSRRKIDPAANELTLLDNGLVFGAKPFVAVVNRWKLEQEYMSRTRPSRME